MFSSLRRSLAHLSTVSHRFISPSDEEGIVIGLCFRLSIFLRSVQVGVGSEESTVMTVILVWVLKQFVLVRTDVQSKLLRTGGLLCPTVLLSLSLSLCRCSTCVLEIQVITHHT